MNEYERTIEQQAAELSRVMRELALCREQYQELINESAQVAQERDGLRTEYQRMHAEREHFRFKAKQLLARINDAIDASEKGRCKDAIQDMLDCLDPDELLRRKKPDCPVCGLAVCTCTEAELKAWRDSTDGPFNNGGR